MITVYPAIDQEFFQTNGSNSKRPAVSERKGLRMNYENFLVNIYFGSLDAERLTRFRQFRTKSVNGLDVSFVYMYK